jgi:LysM domain-containing protein
MNLRDYPRPKDDNGIGLAFRLNLKPDLIEEGVGWLQQIHAKWTLIAGQDWNQILRAAKPVYAAGIMPVCRLICKIDHYNDFVVGVQALRQAGIPPYVQIYNEPGDSREWRGRPDIGRFGGAWGQNAALVLDAGGYPGIQVLGPDEWLAAFNAVKAGNRMDIWEKAWFCLHNGGANHPPAYPYDDINLHGTPVDPATYAQYEWATDIDHVNTLRQSSTHPNATIMTDDTAVLRFLEYRQWMVDSLGFSLPIIGGEAGWAYGGNDDLRYPKINADLHAAYHKEMYEWFATGVVSNGDPLPDELFSVSDWIMADWGSDDWWFGPLGTRQQTIDAVASIPTFTRKFSWDKETQPAGATPVITVPPTTDVTPDTPPPPLTTYVVQHGDTLWAIAKKFGTTTAALAMANNIADPSKIRTGQTLIVPQ